VNAVSIRPQTKFAAALVAAGVVSAASIVGVPEYRGLPAITTDVANASVVTDALYKLGDAVNGVAAGVTIALDGAFSLPFDALTAIAAAAQNPSLSPNVLSWLVQRYVNPSASYMPYTYAWDIRAYSIEPLAGLLPNPFGPAIINAVEQISDAIGGALAHLPSSAPGVDATDAFWGTDIGRTLAAVNYAITAPVWMLYNTVYYLGYLPADLEATFESAIRNPSEVPGLVSNLVYGLLSPSYGLLGGLLDAAARPFNTLPGPIGELASSVFTAISDSVDHLLSRLPDPISPNQSLLGQSSAQFTVTSDEPSALPQASLEVPGAVALSSVDLVEKKVAATDSELNTPPDAPQDTPPVAGGVAEDETPAADTDVPEVKDDKPVTNTVKSGNKVSPGDKFVNQIKGALAKGKTVEEPKRTSTPVDSDVTAGEPEGPADSDSGAADSPAAA
jgi:hypothetical protein